MLWETEEGEQNWEGAGVQCGWWGASCGHKVIGYHNKKGRPRGEGIIQIKLDSSKGYLEGEHSRTSLVMMPAWPSVGAGVFAEGTNL